MGGVVNAVSGVVSSIAKSPIAKMAGSAIGSVFGVPPTAVQAGLAAVGDATGAIHDM